MNRGQNGDEGVRFGDQEPEAQEFAFGCMRTLGRDLYLKALGIFACSTQRLSKKGIRLL